jgi:hypothetical protein
MAREFLLEKNLLQQRQYLEKLELEHKMQIEQKFAQHQVELGREELAGNLQAQALREIAKEQSEQRKLKGTMERRKFQVGINPAYNLIFSGWAKSLCYISLQEG